MLPNYDARAIADVLGLAFLRGPAGGVSSDNSTAEPPGEPERDFVIQGDDTPTLIVAPQTRTASDRSAARNIPGRRRVASDVLPPSSIFIERAVERGLPRATLRRVAEWLAGDDKAKVSVLEWRVVPKTTLDRREARLSPQESERTERIARLVVHARRALGTDAEARDFMMMPHPELDGRTPIDVAKTDLGTRRAEQILNAIEYGLAL